MPVVIDDVKMLIKFVGKDKKRGKILLGDLLAQKGRKVEGANPTKDIRELREDEDVFG